MGSQQQPIVVDSLSPIASGAWASGSTVATTTGGAPSAPGAQQWKNGDTVYAVIVNASNKTVSSVANGGSGLGAWAVVADSTPTNAITSSTTVLEGELWAATATADGQGVITATLSGAGAAGTEIMTFTLVGTQVLADKVVVANTAAAVVAFPAAISVFGDAQALSIEIVAASNNTPVAQTGYTLIGTVVSSNYRIVASIANAYTATAGTSVTPPVSAATQSSGSPSLAFTVLLRSPIPPPTAVTATYGAGVGITVAWTAPAGYTGTGYNVYKLPNSNQNGVPQRLDPVPFQTIPWGTASYVDRMEGYPNVNSGDNVATYYVTTVNGANESPDSITAAATWLG